MAKKLFLISFWGCEMRARKVRVKRIFRHWATAAVIALAALAIEGQGCAKSPSHGSNAAAAPCAPSNYTKVTNTAPMPADFCAYTYLPFRVRLPDHPTQIDTANTTKLQTQYAPNSGPGSSNQGSTVMQTLGQKPTGPEQGNGNHPTYVASPTDPLVTADCVTNGSTTYGCSDMRGNSTFGTPAPHFRIPAWARPAGMHCTNCDVFMSVLQPNGDVVDIGGCRPARDWQDGDVLGAPWVVPGSVGTTRRSARSSCS